MSNLGKTSALIATAILLLCGGIWLGGHPETLPGPGARRLRGRRPRAARRDRGLIKDNFYRPVKESDIDESSLKGIVEGLDDQFSNYLTPKETKQFEQSVQGEFEGVGMNVDEDRRGLRVINVFDGSPAKKARHQEGRVHHRGERALDRRRVQRRGHRPHQGPGRHAGAPGGRGPRRRRAAHAAHAPRADRGAGGRRGGSWSATASRLRRGRAHHLQQRRARPAAPGDRPPAPPRRRGHRARPARQRRRAAARGRAGVLDLHRGRPDHLHQGPHQAARASSRPRATPSPRTSPWWCSWTAAARRRRRS